MMHHLRTGAIFMALLLINIGLFSNVYGGGWVAVKSWTGSGTMSTETFTISSEDWRIRWSASVPTKFQEAGITGTISVWVYHENEGLIDIIANVAVTDFDGGESYLRSSGEYYLKINAASVDWRVIVEEVSEEDAVEEAEEVEQVTGESYSARDVKIIKEWKGTGMPKSTKLFTLKSPTWIIWSSRILPQYENVETAGGFSISVQDAYGVSIDRISRDVGNNADSGHSYLASEGTYSMSISGHWEDWIVQLAEGAIISEPTEDVIAEKVSVSKFFVWGEGIDQSELIAGGMLMVESNIRNNMDSEQRFTYWMEIRDADGITVQISSLSGEIPEGKTFKVGLSWIPDYRGEYTLSTLLWGDIKMEDIGSTILDYNPPSETVIIS